MDAKEALSKLPFTGTLFAILLGIAFVMCRIHDQATQTAVYAYHAQHLLNTEAPLYEDFYSKRLTIDQVGSSDRLALFRSAQRERLKTLMSQLILSDRSFRPYLNDKRHLLFSTRELEHWRSHSQHIEREIQNLSSYKLALIPEQFKVSPEFSRLFSYLFVETDLLNLISNALILLLLFFLLEAHVQRTTLWATLFTLSLAHGWLYLIFASPLTPPLSGANVLTYFLLSLALCRYIRSYILTRSAPQLYLASLIGLFGLLKTGLDSYFQFIFPAQSAGIILSLCLGIFLAYHSPIWREKPRAPEIKTTTAETDSDLPPEFRRPYQDALTALTRFNFAYARSTLAHLHARVPASEQLLESRYHLEKLHPEEDPFWPLLKARIELAIKTADYRLLLELFSDLQQHAEGAQASPETVAPSLYLQMQHIFLQNHNLEKAEQAFKFLQLSVKHSLIKDRASLKDACQLLIEHFARKKLLEKQAHYQALFDNL